MLFATENLGDKDLVHSGTFCHHFHNLGNYRFFGNEMAIRQTMQRSLLMAEVIAECFQFVGNLPVFIESVKNLSSTNGKSRPQPTLTVGGMPSGP